MKNSKDLLSFIDLTSLGGNDTNNNISNLCRKAVTLNVAAVCVFPTFIQTCKKIVPKNMPIATVVGGFPHGQVPLEVKVLETMSALELGATEIDMVINRTFILEKSFKKLEKEVYSLSKICNNRDAKLKTIIEVGELKSKENIELASDIALNSGSHFIKTSTGKAAINANLEAAEIMIQSIKNFHNKTGKTPGFKAAGGVKTFEQAKSYFLLMRDFMGDDYVSAETFRIGASSLVDNL